MTVKKTRRVAEEPSPSPSCAPYRDDARKRIRFQSLSQDYTDFLEETEEKKRRLLEARLRKRKLLAEVRFLRRKLDTSLANPYQQVRLKDPSSTIPVIKPPTEKKLKEGHHQNMMTMEVTNASTSATLGANEVSFKNGEELNKFQLEQYYIQMERLNGVPMIGGGSNDKLASCRHLGNNSKKSGKRKLSWRDPPTGKNHRYNIKQTYIIQD
ncbi:hypothetical protein ZIOFF_004263 [Zingiber officinale]|uniref:Uncharacterized protein n=1 Tax=Zingiber officinale TaxID=94328 RepID=A0A8J5IEN5_ZINOF|nr:hypothetical protein ZIOFF_004263 [Zingiber officinale]